MSNRVLPLMERLGFVSRSASPYGGVRGLVDYGPLGVAMKRNIANEWRREMITRQHDVHEIETSLLLPRRVLQASGHEENFTETFRQCLLSGRRVRATAPQCALESLTTASTKRPYVNLTMLTSSQAERDEWVHTITTRLAPGAHVLKPSKTELSVRVNVQASTPEELVLMGTAATSDSSREHVNETATKEVDEVRVPWQNCLDDETRSPFFTAPQTRSGMFSVGTGSEQLRLRPETTQGLCMYYPTASVMPNVRVPFGLAQIGRSYRDELMCEHLVFRTREFEQMECAYFCVPGTEEAKFEELATQRLAWWRRYARTPENFAAVRLEGGLAHYARAGIDIEYRAFPFGVGELESIAVRGAYDLERMKQATGVNVDVTTGTSTFVPSVVEPSAGLTRGLLAYLYDAFEQVQPTGRSAIREVFHFHPRIAPVKVCVLPLVEKPEFMAPAQDIWKALVDEGIEASLSVRRSVGKRYVHADMIGVPVCVTVDAQTGVDGTVTLRDRDSMDQHRVRLDTVVAHMQSLLSSS